VYVNQVTLCIIMGLAGFGFGALLAELVRVWRDRL
jgi:hypothetical protein